jgi:hypothetical protein
LSRFPASTYEDRNHSWGEANNHEPPPQAVQRQFDRQSIATAFQEAAIAGARLRAWRIDARNSIVNIVGDVVKRRRA